MRRLGLAAVAVVVVQGLLGGLRVTGRFTLSSAPEAMAPSVALALVHGVVGQLFLGLLVVLAAAASRRWREGPAPETQAMAGVDRPLHAWTLALLSVQLALGAWQRHLGEGLLVHIMVGVGLALLVGAAGARAWGLYPGHAPLPRLGRTLLVLLGVQLLLGGAALVATGGKAVVGNPGVAAVTVATAHQAGGGAALLATTVLLAAWTRRLLRPSESLPGRAGA